MTGMKSAQQTNSILRNKTTTLSTQEEKHLSLKFDKFMSCYNLKVIICHTESLDLSIIHMSNNDSN